MRTIREAVTALVVLASLAVPIGAVAQSIYREGAARRDALRGPSRPRGQ